VHGNKKHSGVKNLPWYDNMTFASDTCNIVLLFRAVRYDPHSM